MAQWQVSVVVQWQVSVVAQWQVSVVAQWRVSVQQHSFACAVAKRGVAQGGSERAAVPLHCFPGRGREGMRLQSILLTAHPPETEQ